MNPQIRQTERAVCRGKTLFNIVADERCPVMNISGDREDLSMIEGLNTDCDATLVQ